VSFSNNGGNTWSAPTATETAGDRGYYSAIAISPQGTDAYLVYNAFTTPLRTDTTSPRTLVGVVKHADIGGNGAPGAWGELHRGASGDPRGSSQNNLFLEFLGCCDQHLRCRGLERRAKCSRLPGNWRVAGGGSVESRDPEACAPAGLPADVWQLGHLRGVFPSPNTVGRSARRI